MADMNTNTTETGFKPKRERTPAQLAADQRRKEQFAKAREEKAAAEEAANITAEIETDEPEVDPKEVQARVASMPVKDISNIEEELAAEIEPEPEPEPKKAPEKKAVSITDKPIEEMTDEELLRAAEITRARETLRKQREEQKQRQMEAELAKGEKNMQLVISQQPLVEVYMPWYEGAIEIQSVVVNGVRKDVPIGEHVLLPKSHAEVLFDVLDEKRKNFKRFKTAEKRFKNYENVVRV